MGKKKPIAGAPQPPKPKNVSDLTSIGQNATTARQRRTALDWCLANAWAADDADTLERVDQEGWHGWTMWPRA